MEVEAFIADSAEAAQGKIYALGIGWNMIFAPQFPVVHPRVGVGVVVRVPYTATNQMHSISVHLETEDGARVPVGLAPPETEGGEPQVVSELGGQFSVGRPALLPPGDEQVLTFAMQFDQLRFEAPGMFAWVISVDGSAVKRLPMRVAQLMPGQ